MEKNKAEKLIEIDAIGSTIIDKKTEERISPDRISCVGPFFNLQISENQDLEQLIEEYRDILNEQLSSSPEYKKNNLEVNAYKIGLPTKIKLIEDGDFKEIGLYPIQYFHVKKR